MHSTETPKYGISEENVTRICQNRARHMNSEAMQAGQSNRIQATDLEDLYYKQGGRCATCGVIVEDHGAHKHPKAIRADHIQNVNRRSTFKARACGNEGTGAPIADISNVQWVCHLCNTLKQIVVGAGVDWCDHIANCHGQSSAGFPLRNNADVCGSQSSRRSRRMAWMQEQFAIRGHALSSGEVIKHFAETELEAHLATYLKELKQIGWCGQRHSAELRKQIIQELHEQAWASELIHAGSAEKQTAKEWAAEINKAAKEKHGLKPVSSVRIKQMMYDAGLYFPVAHKCQTQKRKDQWASLALRSAILEIAKDADVDGCGIQELHRKTCERFANEDAVSEELQYLSRIGRLEHIGETVFYCLSRSEAAELLGVSPNRLKKWASRGIGPAYLQCATNPKAECFYSVRSLSAFAGARTKTRYDKVGWQGQTPPPVAAAI